MHEWKNVSTYLETGITKLRIRIKPTGGSVLLLARRHDDDYRALSQQCESEIDFK